MAEEYYRRQWEVSVSTELPAGSNPDFDEKIMRLSEAPAFLAERAGNALIENVTESAPSPVDSDDSSGKRTLGELLEHLDWLAAKCRLIFSQRFAESLYFYSRSTDHNDYVERCNARLPSGGGGGGGSWESGGSSITGAVIAMNAASSFNSCHFNC